MTSAENAERIAAVVGNIETELCWSVYSLLCGGPIHVAHGMTKIDYIFGGTEYLDEVKPLWEQLNQYHANVSLHFGKQYTERKYADRKSEIIHKSNQGKIRVEIARDNGQNIGYCVSTINRALVGEIDSIYVVETYRGWDIGSYLVQSALKWMDSEMVTAKVLVVVAGNETVFNFYKQFGFVPSKTTLMHKDSHRE